MIQVSSQMLSTLKCFNALLKYNDCSSIVDPFEWRFPLFISFARILVSARCPEVHQNPFSCLFTFPPRCSGFIKRCHISGDDLNMLRKINNKKISPQALHESKKYICHVFISQCSEFLCEWSTVVQLQM